MSLELRLWEYGKDNDKIDSFLTTASLAHNLPKKSEDWFHWKFEGSPYGKAILACAFDGDIVAGCIAMGRGILSYSGEMHSYTLVYDTFVHPKYQGHGLFKQLIILLEKSCIDNGSEISYIFPNYRALPGWGKSGYTLIPLTVYKIKIINWFKIIFNFKDIKKGFVSAPSNLSDILDIPIPALPKLSIAGVYVPQWNKEYLKWRFQTFEVGNYWIYSDSKVFAIFRVGNRGNIKEAQLLHVAALECELKKSYWKKIVTKLKKDVQPDMIGVAASKYHPVFSFIKSYIKVPNRSQFTYKYLNSELRYYEFKLAKCGIDAHTY